jgi:nucleotidyltransferase substrate binding protein (TIGR01987 family)
MGDDIRWKQRFANFKKAYAQLEKAVQKPQLSELEQEGLIQRFEYTYELAWNTLKDYLEYAGVQDMVGSRSAIQEAFKRGLITDGYMWMDMFKDRNKTSHTYNKATAEAIAQNIRSKYYQAFEALKIKLEQLH